MTTTEQIVVTLPTELVDAVRAKVSSGQYGSENEFICESILLHAADDSSDKAWGPSDQWIIKHALPVLREMEANPASCISHEEMLAEFSESPSRVLTEAG